MVKHIKTTTGFECDIDNSVIDDMELFDSIAELQAGDVMAVPTVINKLVGDYKKALYDHVRLENGRVPTQAVVSEITEILTELNGKN